MKNWYVVLELCSDFMEAWLCYHFIRVFLPERVKGRLTFVMLSLTLVGSVRAMEHFKIDPLISTLWFVFFLCMTTVVVFQVDLFYAVSLVSFYFLCMYIIDYFSMSVMGVIARNRQFAQFILNQLSLWRCAYLAADKAMLVLFYFLARRAFGGMRFYHPRMVFCVSLTGTLGVGFLSLFTLKEISVLTLFSWGLCLVILLCFCLIMLFYANVIKERELRGFLELKNQLVHQEYEMVRQMQTEQETLSHNMKNHLLVLEGMLNRGETDHARAYISQLRTPLLNLSPAIWTGTPTLDVLLNHTRSRSDRAGISFTTQADALDLHPMEDHDICSLFANLLDNAFEASTRMPPGQGWILVKIRRIREMVFIDISNSAPNAPCRKNGKLVSGKNSVLPCNGIGLNSMLHGIGLNSASMSAAKYGGQLDYEYKDHVFFVRVSFLGGIQSLRTSQKRLRKV